MKRSVHERIWRGHYRVVIEGVLLGEIKQAPGKGWIATPILPTPSEHCCDSDPDGYRGSLGDATEWLLDYSGLPFSVARAYTLGWDLDEEQQEWFEKFLVEIRERVSP